MLRLPRETAAAEIFTVALCWPGTTEIAKCFKRPEGTLAKLAGVRFTLAAFLLIFAISASGQQAQGKNPPVVDLDQNVQRIDKLEGKARSILAVELKRQSPCALEKSNADWTVCLARQLKITEANYEAFRSAVRESLAFPFPEDPSGKLYPIPAADFWTAELAWQTFRDKSCEALLQTYEGGSAGPAAEISCNAALTRQHMKELAKRFLDEGTKSE